MQNIHRNEINLLKAIKEGFKPANFHTVKIDHEGLKWVESFAGGTVTTVDMDGQWSMRYDNEGIVEMPDDSISARHYSQLTSFLTDDNIGDVLSFVEELSADEEKHVITEKGSWYTNPWEKPDLTDLQQSIIEWLYSC